jgi:RNA polymerase-binding transcription factor DksA
MNQKQLLNIRNTLLALLERVRTDAKSVEEKALGASGGQANGGLSNVPMDPADLATDTFMQKLNETLLENERYVVSEISAALRRIEEGSFGLCDNCRSEILDARIEALPYTRHCVSCAEIIRPEPVLNLRSAGSPGK